MTINKKNNEEKEEMPITKVNNRSQEIYDHHQGKLQIIKKKSPSPKPTIDEKKETTITKANNKSKEGNDHH